MNKEVRFKTEEYNYYNRAACVLKKGDKYLIMNVDNSDYFHIPGGHIEIGEDSLKALKREIKEELNYEINNTKVFCIQENFYKKKNKMHHGIEFYYLVKVKEDIKEETIIEDDKGVKKTLLIKWASVDELKNIDLRPNTIKELIINNKINKLTHIINRD